MQLILVLGDQLTPSVSSLQKHNDGDVILMAEVREEATYVKHHKKKIAFVFSAMRHFAEDLKVRGLNVIYREYDAPDNQGSLSGEVQRAVAQLTPEALIITAPGEFRLLDAVQNWEHELGIPVSILEDDRFLASRNDFADWANGRKQLRMEFFYREMRKKHSVLMEPDGPTGGQWNYDTENRRAPLTNLDVPAPYSADPDTITQQVLELIETEFPDHFGDLAPFSYAVTRQGALEALASFIQERLPKFGDWQDAMLQDEPWMYHSHIALYLNVGLLDPMECIQQAEHAYRQGHAPLNAVEGFIRQILGWREYVRGLYWHLMPDYKERNFLHASRPLPAFYWTAQTRMNCLRQTVLETQQNAYAHHIQRLMVLGNFALLAGLDPDQVNDWYLQVYADAYEWVELPNVHGMVLYADGGVLASKPYAASGAYIKKMSNYCAQCSYNVNAKNGPKACPFNYLYWDFIDRNAQKLRGNPRMGFVFKTHERMSNEKRQAIREDAQRFFKALEENEKV
ncbi:cryptochrome/photolyase family protein [Shimia sp. R10_1]|uniref:cryptochrome/photolyase family protein n=1 Tax=Shimia sp. R10_1 TaxID=2821095 RepID=UPI001AD97CB6|nr:cryptochrome/photolyase family protein [Shimia sp. R10_1]MBO9475273.1 cryptochrome/photolyase family protein [Shimia sp. R10_1]